MAMLATTLNQSQDPTPTAAPALAVVPGPDPEKDPFDTRPPANDDLVLRRLEVLTRLGKDIVLLLDAGGFVIAANDRAAVAYGYSVGELRRLHIQDLRAPDTLDELPSQFSRALRDDGVLFETTHRRRDGSAFPVEVSACAFNVGNRRFVQSVIRDVSEHRRAGERLSRAERLAGAGTMAASMADEVAGPLDAVVARLEYAVRELPVLIPAGGPATEAVREALHSAQRARELVTGLRGLGRGALQPRGPVSVKAEIEAAVLLVRGELRGRARLELDLHEGVRPVSARPFELSQAFVNLLLNVVRAQPGGPAGHQRVRIALRQEAADAVIMVEDLGAGGDPSAGSSLLDQRQPASAHTSRSGVGLPICHAIVTSLGGRVEVDGSPGRGDTFRVRIPTVPPPAAVAGAGVRRLGLAPRARVLVVDQDPRAGQVVDQAISGHGEVVSVRSGPEALAMLEKSGEFDFILCELVLPGMSGLELLRTLERHAPAQARRVVFTSSATPTPEAFARVMAGAVEILLKPIDPATLRRAVLDRAISRRSVALTPPAPDGARPA